MRKRTLSLALCLMIVLGLVLPLTARAQEPEQKVVRVGWYESTYCYRDQYGQRRGIAYEYQRKIAAHTGWTYEYVEDSWPNLLQMLIDGEIDLLSDVSWTEQRAELMLFPTLAMGAESYYIYIDADNDVIDSENLQSLNGKRVAVNKGSFQEGLLRDWAGKNDVSLRIVELSDNEAYTMDMLARGEVDALVSMDSFGSQERVVPVTKIGASDYYFAVNKARPDLLAELNAALTAIQDEDPYFNQRMFDQYVNLTRTNAFLTPRLESWLESHGAVRIGYWEDYLPFCASDRQTGALTGALKDWLAHASNCLKNAEIPFEAVPCPSTDAALAAMKRGEIDCVFPINLSTYSGEMMGVLTTNAIAKTEMSLLMRAEGRAEITPGKKLTVAVDVGNTNYSLPKQGPDFFTESREHIRSAIYPEDLNRFLLAFTRETILADIERHGIFTLTYRLMLEGKPRYVRLKAVMVEEKEGTRLIVGVNDIDKQVHQEETYVKNLAQAKIEASVDALTGVKNRHAYLMAEERLNSQIKEGRDPAFAVVVLDVNDLKTVNDSLGHDAGDQYIRDACRIVCSTFKRSPVFRIGGDEFAVISQGEDYARIEELMRQMDEHNEQALQNGGIIIACGMARREGDETVAPVFERADQNMYGNKSDLKAGKA